MHFRVVGPASALGHLAQRSDRLGKDHWIQFQGLRLALCLSVTGQPSGRLVQGSLDLRRVRVTDTSPLRAFPFGHLPQVGGGDSGQFRQRLLADLV